ncbi:hypothetical protein HDU98_009812 [Podochytrium sp. JEL0797]|nr:hypothetical protein HDU98_009812 [Podochytrium sp. JEL0797]
MQFDDFPNEVATHIYAWIPLATIQEKTRALSRKHRLLSARRLFTAIVALEASVQTDVRSRTNHDPQYYTEYPIFHKTKQSLNSLSFVLDPSSAEPQQFDMIIISGLKAVIHEPFFDGASTSLQSAKPNVRFAIPLIVNRISVVGNLEPVAEPVAVRRGRSRGITTYSPNFEILASGGTKSSECAADSKASLGWRLGWEPCSSDENDDQVILQSMEFPTTQLFEGFMKFWPVLDDSESEEEAEETSSEEEEEEKSSEEEDSGNSE